MDSDNDELMVEIGKITRLATIARNIDKAKLLVVGAAIGFLLSDRIFTFDAFVNHTQIIGLLLFSTLLHFAKNALSQYSSNKIDELTTNFSDEESADG